MASDTAAPLTRTAAGCLRVAIVEDNHKYREMLAVLINGTRGHRCVGSYVSMEEALERLPRERPDVVLVDIGLPGRSGMEGVRLFREFPPPDRADHELTPHEARILRLLVEGHSYKSAAAALGVAVPTVSFHLQRIYEKLHVHSESAAVAKALRHRLA